MLDGPVRKRLRERLTSDGGVVSRPDSSRPQSDEQSTGETQIDDPILEQAETWYSQISKQDNKRKMMKNYLRSITDLDESEIDQKLDEAGL